jgi:hypothetical protein
MHCGTERQPKDAIQGRLYTAATSWVAAVGFCFQGGQFLVYATVRMHLMINKVTNCAAGVAEGVGAAQAAILLGPRSVVDAALALDSTGDESALLQGMAVLARQDSALSLRLAMILAWVKRQDAAAELGMSFTSFVRERVGLGTSWLRELIRLVESPLNLVNTAASQELIPLRVATKAPGKVQPQEQEAWLLKVLAQREEQRQTRAEARLLDEVDERDVEVVRKARRLARICLGQEASHREIDDYIIRCWQQKLSGATILAQGRKPPPKPTWEGEINWHDSGHPAASLLGPWAPPTSLQQALAQIEGVQALQRGRAAVLARAWMAVGYHASWCRAGFDSQWDFALKVLGWSKSTAQRKKKLGYNLEWYPELDEAVRQWLDVGSAFRLTKVIDDKGANRWLALTQRVGRLELYRAVEEAQHTCGRSTLEQYEKAISTADRWAKEQRNPSSSAPSVVGAPSVLGVPSAGGGDVSGAPSAGGGGESSVGAASSAGAPLLVSLPQTSAQQAKPLKAPPELPEASRWFVQEVNLPKQYGFARIKARDGFECQNPECRRTTLRTEAHHIHWRSRGGSDDLDNGVTVCRVCHLRGIHTGIAGAPPRIVVEPIMLDGMSALLWTYIDGRQVMVFRTYRRTRTG